MRDYGKVHSTFWSSDTIRSLSDDGKTLAMYLITSPHGTIVGAFRLPNGYICDDIEWPEERVAKAVDELIKSEFAVRCEKTKWLWIKKHLKWNKLENPNQIVAACKVVATIPLNCAWLLEFVNDNTESLSSKNKPFRNPFETLSKPITITTTVTETVAITGTIATAIETTDGEKDIASTQSDVVAAVVVDINDVERKRHARGQIAAELKSECQIIDINPSNPEFIALCELGLQSQDFVNAANSVNEPAKRRFNYILKVAKSKHEETLKVGASTNPNQAGKQTTEGENWMQGISFSADGKIIDANTKPPKSNGNGDNSLGLESGRAG